MSYTARFWDQTSPINGCPADKAIQAFKLQDGQKIGILSKDNQDCLTQIFPVSATDTELKAWCDTENTNEFNQIKSGKLSAMSATCQSTIYAGMDIKDSQGTEHFSLTTADQINISNLVAAIKAGATSVAYHADGKLCRMFTANEITNIYTKVISFIAYHTTLYNHLKVWIDRSTTEEEIMAIEYTSTLPDDLKANMDQIISAMTTSIPT